VGSVAKWLKPGARDASTGARFVKNQRPRSVHTKNHANYSALHNCLILTVLKAVNCILAEHVDQF